MRRKIFCHLFRKMSMMPNGISSRHVSLPKKEIILMLCIIMILRMQWIHTTLNTLRQEMPSEHALQGVASRLKQTVRATPRVIFADCFCVQTAVALVCAAVID